MPDTSFLLPDVLRGYEDILPGSANRIVTMVEQEARHRHVIELRGQIFGFSVAAGFIAAIFMLLATALPPW